MTDKCSICGNKINEGDGRFNLPGGVVKCMECYDKPTTKPSKFIKIAGFEIPSKMLLEYASKVEMTRNAASVGLRQNNPLLIMKALQVRVEIHKKICKITGYDHDDTSKKAMKVRDELEKWLNENTFNKPQENGLI